MGNDEGQGTLSRRRLDPPAPPRRVLRAVFSPDARCVGRVWPLDGSAWVFGREAPQTIVDPRLSRRHCRLGGESHPSLVEDLESKNGTFVDGRSVRRLELSPQAVVRIGDTLLVVDEAVDRAGRDEPVPEIVGASLATSATRGLVHACARSTGPVLILGPPGCGKEVVAAAIHRLSGRTGHWTTVNCAALPATLIEAELFGHARGAFSGAGSSRAGLVRDSDGGTLFLDEIGEMPPDQQARLLRVIEERRVRPLGTDRALPVDVRVVAATNAAVSALRPDLYARLVEWVVRVVPLRERRADILPIWWALWQRAGGPSRRMTPEAAESLLLHAWPENVRGVDRLARRLALAAGTAPLDVGDLPDEMPRLLVERDADAPLGRGPDRAALERALAQANGNVAEVARAFGRERMQVYRWLERHGLDPARFRGE